MRAPTVPAILAIVGIIVVCLSSAHAIDDVVTSNAPPTIDFSLGTAYRDLGYCNSQTLDLYIPSGAAVHPLAMYVHGGGLSAGDKGDLNPNFLNALASAGYAVASVDYRLAPQYKFPAQIEDVKCAIRYLRDHAQMYNLNASEFFAFGTSSGGELIALAALTGGHSEFDVGAYLNESSGITAAVDMFGPANLTADSGYSASDIFRVFGNNMSDEMLASPTNFVTANAPPMLIIHGLNDSNVPPSQSIQLYDDLRAAGDQAQLVLVQNMGHMFVQVGLDPISPSVWQIIQVMVNFFGRYAPGYG
jgi:acetyl esterase/lipase